MRLLGAGVLAAREGDLLRDVAARIDQAVVRFLWSSSLPALEEKVREEDRWSQIGGRLPLGDRLWWAAADRSLGRAEG